MVQSWNVVFNFFFFFFLIQVWRLFDLWITLKMFHDADLFAVHKFHLEQAAKERYHNHGFARLEIIVRGGCSILSGSLSAWDREQGSEGDDRKRCRRVTENVCCVNDAETLWRNLGQQRKRSIFFFFFPPSLRIVVGISLPWSIESCSRLWIDIVFSLPHSFSLVVNEKDRILLDERFDFSRRKKEFRIDLYFSFFEIGTILGQMRNWNEDLRLKLRFSITEPVLGVFPLSTSVLRSSEYSLSSRKWFLASFVLLTSKWLEPFHADTFLN